MEGLWHRMNIKRITAGIYPYDNNFTRAVFGKGGVCQFGVPRPKNRSEKRSCLKDKASPDLRVVDSRV
jgi:hypothetical protein